MDIDTENEPIGFKAKINPIMNYDTPLSSAIGG